MKKFLDELTLADDLIFEKVMSDVNFAKILLQRIIGCRIKEITKHITQRVNDNGPEIHGSRFDVWTVGDSKHYDIEMQRFGSCGFQDQQRLLRRARYYEGELNHIGFKPGMDYTELHDSIVIFICMFDPFGDGLAQYTEDCRIRENGRQIYNGRFITYLNAMFRHDNVSSELSSFLRYLRDPTYVSESTDDFIHTADVRVRALRGDFEFRGEYMSYLEKLEERERLGAHKERGKSRC